MKRLSLPPRLHDAMLDGLSVSDHVKYLYFHAKYKSLRRRVITEGNSQSLLEFANSLDWVRNVNFIFQRFQRYLGWAYISHTFPSGEWPGNPQGRTIPVVDFGFAYYLNLSGDWTCDAGQLESHCFRCGKLARVLLPLGPSAGCGCSAPLLKPVRVGLVCEDNSLQSLYRSHLKSCGRSIDTCPVSTPAELSAVDVVVGLVKNRMGPLEPIFAAATDLVPVYVLRKGSDRVANVRANGVSDSVAELQVPEAAFAGFAD